MNTETTDIILRKSAFLQVALITAIILLIPLVAMQFTNEVNWDLTDFILMGFLLFSMGSLFIIISRKIHRKHRFILVILFAVVFLYIWAELAVGILFGLGS
ncbi:MAG: hypothetical protein ACI9N9_000375 [Enterobacterales bacterium]|jgi:hypothetical protein